MLYALFFVVSFFFCSKSFTGSCLGKPLSKQQSKTKHVVPLVQQKKQQEEVVDNHAQLQVILTHEYRDINEFYTRIKPYIEKAAKEAVERNKADIIETVMNSIIVKACILIRAGAPCGTFPLNLKHSLFTDFCKLLQSISEREDVRISNCVRDCTARALLALRQALIKETKDVKACREYVKQQAMTYWGAKEVGSLIDAYVGYIQEGFDYEDIENVECLFEGADGRIFKLLVMPENGIKPCEHPAFNHHAVANVCWGPCKEVCETFGLDLSKHPWRNGKPCTYPGMPSSCVVELQL